MATDLHARFHETWLGLVQPVEGLVVSVPVLVEAQCMERHGPGLQETFRALCPPIELGADGSADSKGRARRRHRDLGELLASLLGWTPELYDRGDALPANLSRYISEGHQTIRPTLALRKLGGAAASASNSAPRDGVPDIETPESQAGKPYVALVWELPAGLPLDRPETETGDWRYPPAAKLDRLLRACRVPIGLLTNGEAIRLVYAPHGEATGSITFDLTDMGEVGGRPILDAFVMLLGARRFFGVRDEDALPALLARSRAHQANVTNTLAAQVFEALDTLLRGFEAAARRDSHADLRALLELSRNPGDPGDDADAETHRTQDDHVYGGLLTVLLRLVFLLYAEDRELLPTEHPSYASSLSLGQLFEDLRRDHGAFPDTMTRRHGAWSRLLALFRAVHDGVEHGDFHIPARRGELFDPSRYPFLESWGLPDTAPAKQLEDMARVGVPTIDDETVYRVLERLMVLEGQRLSYKVLDVEQLGSVYEALMGYGVQSLGSRAVCCRHKSLQSGGRGGVWIEAAEILACKPDRREKLLVEDYDVVKGDAAKIADDLKAAKDEAAVLDALDRISLKRVERRGAGQLVIQPGEERRRTSSHYTPRSLSEPIVQRTLEPLLMAMSQSGEPRSAQLLDLKICDPAMGSGAFLVAACRFLADQVVAAWEREGQTEKVASASEDVVTHARRLVAQRCLYGVDKNPLAVNLAKLSLWLVTLAKNEPFTFVDHCLRHGDSLVGLSFEQIKAFHWAPEAQMALIENELASCIEESLSLRQHILDLAGESSPGVTRLKEQLLWDANDAQERIRIIGDLVVGAFFEGKNDKERKAERVERLALVQKWLADGASPSAEIVEMRERIRARIPVFHWWLEFPEVFHRERLDPLQAGQVNHGALMDAFVGNPPFGGKNRISDSSPRHYIDWLMEMRPEVKGKPNTDLCAYFFRRCRDLLGRHGSLGLIATNTISQGDTRLMSLKALIETGAEIYHAIPDMPWPGTAAVVISVIHIAVGSVRDFVRRRHIGAELVPVINSRLRGKPERPEPAQLAANSGIAFMGGKIVGIGLAVSAAEAKELIGRDPANAEILRPYLGGEDLNQRTHSAYERYVIDFTDKTIEEARKWPLLLSIVEEKVKPVRIEDKRGTYKTYWWRPGESGRALYEAIDGLQRCLVTARVTKHLAFSFHSTSPFFNEKIYVFSFDDYPHFTLLQSRAHESWVRLLSSTMKTDLNYSASDCFDTFPFPPEAAMQPGGKLEAIGEALYEFRAKLMVERDQGLTTTYNQLKDPEHSDPEIDELRRLHVEMDRAVLAAYGWSDIEPPPFTEPVTEDEKRVREAFDDEVIDRLFALNAERAAEERVLGMASGKGKRKAAKPTAAGAPATAKKPARKTSKKMSKPGPSSTQLSLTGDPDPDPD
jgi:N-6 DNA Methylase